MFQRNSRLKYSLALAVGLLLIGGGLFYWLRARPTNELRVEKFRFSAALRRDPAQPLTAQDLSGHAAPFYSSGTADSPLLDELYPSGAAFADEASRRAFRRSKCFWTFPGDQIKLSWNVVAEGIKIPGRNCNLTEMVMGEGAHPVSRERLRCDNQEVNVEELQESSGAFLLLHQCRPSDPPEVENPFNECRNSESNCHTLRAACGLEPGYGKRFLSFRECALTVEKSGTYQAYLTRDWTNALALKTFAPTFSVIENSTVMSRSLIEESAPEAGAAGPVYSWTLKRFDGEPFDGSDRDEQAWEENFSPVLFIARIRAFQESDTIDVFRYLKIRRVFVYQLAPGDLRGKQIAACQAGADGTITRASCRDLENLNPAYAERRKYLSGSGSRPPQLRPLRWVVEFDGRAPTASRLDPTRETRLEFTIERDRQ